ncbi:MAG: EcsC family protein [Caulobacteraceae bacterium]|nr:MAG: EcsC family protein [Caulobacteraceae bacterium]
MARLDAHEEQALAELEAWRARRARPPGPMDRAARNMQAAVNNLIPEPIHAAVTKVIEGLTRTILTGSDLTTAKPLLNASFGAREGLARQRIAAYRTMAAAEGGVAGAGGFLLAAADFPVLIGFKIKLLFEIAALYGHDGESWDERLYILSIFQLAFSNADHRQAVLQTLETWDETERVASPDAFDWRTFQQQYRDYIDLAKLAQLIPVIGAPVGAFVNYRLLDQLGAVAMNAYRMRWLRARG